MSTEAAPAPPSYEDLDRQRDSLHILPLSTMPVEHPFVKRALMIKNARLDSVIEMFKDVGGAGSGQRCTPSAPMGPNWGGE